MRTDTDSGVSSPARILSSGSVRTPCSVSPEKPAKSIETCARSNAASTWGRRPTGRSVWARTNAPLPSPEVAERAGHSVDVLLSVYAKCIDGDRDAMNKRIEAALAA